MKTILLASQIKDFIKVSEDFYDYSNDTARIMINVHPQHTIFTLCYHNEYLEYMIKTVNTTNEWTGITYFYNFISALKQNLDNESLITIECQNNQLTCKASYNQQLIQLSEFSTFNYNPNFEPTISFSLPAKTLVDALSKIKFVMVKRSNNTLIHTTNGKLTLTSTDTHKLPVVTIDTNTPNKEHMLYIKNLYVYRLIKLLNISQTDTVIITVNEEFIKFSGSNYTYIAQLEQFDPYLSRYEAITSETFDYSITLTKYDVKLILEVCKKILNKNKEKCIILYIDNSTLFLQTKNKETVNVINLSEPTKLMIEFAVNAKALKNILQQVNNPVLYFNNYKNSLLMVEDNNYKCYFMPVILC